MSKSSIGWTQQTWNPTTGCNKVSQGCKHCYAETMHKRLQGMGQAKYKQDFNKGVVTHDDALTYPLTIKKPTLFFVNSMSDLFHDDVPFEFISKVLGIILECPQHTFQILTKRASRMAEYFDYLKLPIGVFKNQFPNVWFGVSCEDQNSFDERAKHLFLIDVAVRFLSCEPLLGPIDFDTQNKVYRIEGQYHLSAYKELLHWVIAGGESGHGARPMHPDWVRSLRDQCAEAGVPFFFKQWGEWEPDSHVSFNGPFFIRSKKHFVIDIDGHGHFYRDMFDYNEEAQKKEDELNITKKSNAWWMANTGKSKSGNLLDGFQHLNFPR